MKICILYLVTCQEGYDFGLNMNKDICPLLYPVPSLSNTNKISENKDLAFFSLISLCSVGPDIETRKLSDCRLYKPAEPLNLTFKASRSVYWGDSLQPGLPPRYGTFDHSHLVVGIIDCLFPRRWYFSSLFNLIIITLNSLIRYQIPCIVVRHYYYCIPYENIV